MNYFKITLVVFLFVTGFLHTQKRKSNFSAQPDLSKIKLKLKGTVLPDNELQHQKIMVPFQLKRNNILLNSNIYLYPGLFQTYNSFKQHDKLASAKNSISEFLILKYNDIPKYDLGKFGVYLGISKKVFAIILGIISLL